MKFDFENRHIVIAGIGGIGQEIVKLMGSLESRLSLVDVNPANLNDTLSNLNKDKAKIYLCDFSDIDNIASVVESIVEENGPIDGLVFCVGIDQPRPFKMANYEYMLKIMKINFFSYVELIRNFTQKGRFNSGLSIVGISSVGAYLGNPSQTAYCASKAAMNGATRCLAKELSSRGIRLNTIAPGTTDTPMFREAQVTFSGEDAFEERLARQYLGLCKPEDIANCVVFLLSNMSRMITGACISVDGGKLTS